MLIMKWAYNLSSQIYPLGIDKEDYIRIDLKEIRWEDVN
jgi:hypothetical protein